MIYFHRLISAMILGMLPSGSSAFSLRPNEKTVPQSVDCRHTTVYQEATYSRSEFLFGVLSLAVGTVVGGKAAVAEDAIPALEAPVQTFSITKCNVTSKAPCISTSNVRNMDLYLPPWTFSTSAAECMARLKGAIVADPSCLIVQQDGDRHLLVEAKRNDLFGSVDTLEFVVNDNDKVVTFRSLANNENSDFGLNRKRLDEIRKRAGVFGIMGEGLNSADSLSSDMRGNGPLGQLKAFYGLQSGTGLEDVILEK